MTSVPATPPYEYHTQETRLIESTNKTHYNLILSPPELLLDTSEDEEEELTDDIATTGLLWSIRKSIMISKKQKFQRRVKKPIKIYIPKAQWPPKPEPKLVHRVSSGRPTRVKGPCQACQETSDGCMRKAFNWPFPTNEVYNDKGKPFVYLCNKCGLRYNKSGGCVCRHCRWVLCKEEKRKAMQLIEQMRRINPNLGLEDDIDNFICTPKYWHCGHPWKVGWILQSQFEELS